MAVTSSPYHVELGSDLPRIALPDLDANPVTIQPEPGEKPLLVFFGCNHCPYVRHVESALGELLSQYSDAIDVLAISSNDVDQYPDDDVAGLRSQALRAAWDFPYLVDEDQSAAKAFNAACTPDFFLYDRARKLIYRGAFDASTPKNSEPLTGDLLRTALEAALTGDSVPQPHRPAMGCGIKWKPGNEPQTVFTA